MSCKNNKKCRVKEHNKKVFQSKKRVAVKTATPSL